MTPIPGTDAVARPKARPLPKDHGTSVAATTMPENSDGKVWNGLQNQSVNFSHSMKVMHFEQARQATEWPFMTWSGRL